MGHDEARMVGRWCEVEGVAERTGCLQWEIRRGCAEGFVRV